MCQSVQKEALNKLDAELTQIADIGLIKGFGVSVVTKDSALFVKGYGYSDTARQLPYTANSIQNIGSVSKTLIGIALLKAKEMGKLNLDDPINDHLDFEVLNPYHPDVPILIWHLATHTSTIQDTDLYDRKAYYLLDKNDLNLEVVKKLGENFQTLDNKVTMKTYLQNFLSKDGPWFRKKNFLKRKPGDKYEYSNVGATLAAQVIEAATGISYDVFTRRYILGPLQMRASGWSIGAIDVADHSKLFSEDGVAIPKYSLVTYPDGGLLTDLNDFSTYLSELIKGYYGAGALLKQSSYEILFKQRLPQKKVPKKRNCYDDEFNSGIFMGITPAGYVGHSGSDPGIATFMFFDPNSGLGHIIMLNTSLSGASVEKQLIPIFKAVQKALN